MKLKNPSEQVERISISGENNDELFSCVTSVTALEFIDTTCCIHKLNNSCKKRVRFMRDIQFY